MPAFSSELQSIEESRFECSSHIKLQHISGSSINNFKNSADPLRQPINSLRIDLHGYSQEEAREVLIKVIKRAYTNRANNIFIITGRGKHANSNGKRGILKANVPNWLSSPVLSGYIKDIKEEIGAYFVILNHSTIPQENVISELQLSHEDLSLFAHAGSPEAQYVLGVSLLEKNNKEFIKWLRKAASQDHKEALFLLGYAHAMGRNVKYDPSLASQFYERAALLGHESACINLGTMHWSGEAGQVSLKKAKYWYKREARLGSIQSQRQLGIIYFTEKNYSKAFLWNTKAAEEDDAHAQVNLGCMYLDGLATDRNVNFALELFEKSGKGGVSEGWMRLGMAYLNGDGIQKDYTKAAKFLLIAALAGNDSAESDAQYFLSIMFKNGYGFKVDNKIADHWLLKAAKNDHTRAQFAMGLKCEKTDINEALTWHKKASERKHAMASYRLFELYELGIHGIQQDHAIASKYLKKAAREGHFMASTLLRPLHN